MDTLGAAKIAVACGADRLELCADLGIGGLTPDPGLLDQVMGELSVMVQVMIRPRGGGFVYTEDEAATMAAGIRFIRKTWPGIRGFVTGALTAEGTLDEGVISRLQEAAAGYPLTLHRAFDRTRNPAEALERCAALGIERILTSGGAQCAEDGIAVLADLHRRAAGRVIILPGGGVSPHNARRILDGTGVSELHLSARKPVVLGPQQDDLAYLPDSADLRALRRILNEQESR